MADTADAVSIETVNVTVYRVKEPAKVPIAKSETKGCAPSTDANLGFQDSGTCQGSKHRTERGMGLGAGAMADAAGPGCSLGARALGMVC